MSTSIESILLDIIAFLKKCFKTFLAVFTRSYEQLAKAPHLSKTEILSPHLYVILVITVFYSLTVGISRHEIRGATSLINFYFLGLKDYSLSERLLCSIPILIGFFLTIKSLALLVKKNDRRPLIYFTSYFSGTYLLLFLLVRLLLFVIYYLGWEFFFEGHFHLQETHSLVDPIFNIIKKLDWIMAGLVFTAGLYKVIGYLKTQTKKPYVLLCYPFFLFLCLWGILNLAKLEIRVLDYYFPQNDIQITTQLESHDHSFLFQLIEDGDSANSMQVIFYVTNNSRENIILENKPHLLYFEESEHEENMLADSLNGLPFIFKCVDVSDSSSLIISSGDTRIIKFEAAIDSNRTKWWLGQFYYDKRELDVYLRINFRSTDRFFSAPYYRTKIVIRRET